MAQNFSTSGAQTAGVLLKTIPEAQQSVIAKELTTRLRSSYDDAAASVAVELVAGRNDATLIDDLLDVLKARIEHGSPESVSLLLSSSTELSRRLVEVAVAHLETAEKRTPIESTNTASDSVDDEDHDGLDGIEAGEQDLSRDVSLQWLRFAKTVSPASRTDKNEDALFSNALAFLHHTNRPTALAARDLVFLLFSTSPSAQRNLEKVRDTISSLITARDAKLQQTLGYALWMRLLAASDVVDLSSIDLNDDAYWEPLLHGLQNGDAERRKMCLDILKRSVALALEQGKTGAVASNDTATSNIVSYQYSRYCAVFETLVLARYTNLVVECERDLNLLASADSIIQSKWLYAMLATALDVKTQDQNRKFIGDWILRSDLFSSRFPDGLAGFLSASFLPWAMEGHLFVSSTKQNGSQLSCRHGDRLATFICNLLSQTATDARSPLLDAMFDFLFRKHATLFAYSAVHLIRGVSQAFESIADLTLTKEQIERVLFTSALRTLPEVATDYLVVQCWKICQLAESHSGVPLSDSLSSIGQTRFDSLKEAAESVTKGLSLTETETFVPRVNSQRDIKIAESVQKCKNVLSDPEAPRRAGELQPVLEDIWSDLEYLEYPRALLVELPTVFFNPPVFKAALEENADEGTGLRELLSATLPRLLDLSQRRSFLLAPLMGSIREVVLSLPESVTIIDLEECILRICQNPPESSIDLRMEYSTIPLLSSLQNVQPDDCRDRYFGHGEGYGFAAYLDLISRIGTQQPELIQSLLDKLLARWKKQKVPTPTISAWKTTLQLQVMLLCFEQHTVNADRATLDPMLKDMYLILSLEPLPRFRYLMEWIIVRIQIRHPDLRSETLDMLSTKDHQSNPKFLASLMKMGVMLATGEFGSEDFARSLSTIFIALSSSSKIIIRHEAQWAFPQLMDHARANDWQTILANPAYTSLDAYIRSLPRFGDPPAERLMSKFDPIEDHTLTNLVEGLWTDLDYTRAPYTDSDAFASLYSQTTPTSTSTLWPKSCMTPGPAIPKPPRPEPLDPTDPNKPLLGPKQMTQDEAIALQTKGTAYLKTSLETDSSTNAQTHKHDLLLVASLIENPYNLGGLSRVSEIFGARAMHVSDPRIIAEKDFTSVAVSSHHHVDILPLTMENMASWMSGKKREGWTVVGIEQTDRSVLLGQKGAELPAKTILVLGSEREGMPAAVLGECDLLVEIPQVGVTRSLNVQTAAAIVLFEYGRQHGKKG